MRPLLLAWTRIHPLVRHAVTETLIVAVLVRRLRRFA